MKRIYVDRSRYQAYLRCRRARYLEYHAGESKRGIVPVRKSIHLVIGGAVHTGLEVLLREGQNRISTLNFGSDGIPLSLEQKLATLFEVECGSYQLTDARLIEDAAVAAALADLAAATEHGVELDTLEQGALDANSVGGIAGNVGTGGDSAARPTAPRIEESAIIVSFDEVDAGLPPEPPMGHRDTSMSWPIPIAASLDFGAPIYPVYPESSKRVAAEDDERLNEIQIKVQQNESGIDDYLKLELAALVEAMVRAYARRRLRPLLEQFEVLEVEREGSWRLAELPESFTGEPAELWFASRHDGLLLERATNDLYLLSYKTTGQWDRRRAMDAEVDMQGLSEAVDVERRMAEAWRLIQDERKDTLAEVRELVTESTQEFLTSLPEPPRILGVRYEYLIKGRREQDKNDLVQPGRYVNSSPLVRAYKMDGITAEDRKWAHSYVTCDLTGKEHRLSWQAWKKAPVWRYMPIAEWVDLLDKGDIQPDAYDAAGYALDPLAAQFIPPIAVMRNSDDMRDMLEQLEAIEVQIAADVAAVQAVQNNPAQFRSELNKRFAQTRSACSYPGRCSYFLVCYSGSGTDLREHPERSELFQIRIPNHPVETGEAAHDR